MRKGTKVSFAGEKVIHIPCVMLGEIIDDGENSCLLYEVEDGERGTMHNIRSNCDIRQVGKNVRKHSYNFRFKYKGQEPECITIHTISLSHAWATVWQSLSPEDLELIERIE